LVGRDLPSDVLEKAQKEEQLRRERSNILVQSEDDFSWLTEDTQD
jgi:hypothetical protein